MHNTTFLESLLSPESLERHSRKCSICNHPDRDSIEQDYLSWLNPFTISLNYHLADHFSIYRHVRATGLDNRRLNVRSALEWVIEQAQRTGANSNAVVSAVRAYAKIDSTGRWCEPPAAPKA